MPEVNILAGCDPHDPQRGYIESDATFASALAGIGGGKSYGTMYACLRLMARDAALYHARGERWQYVPEVPVWNQDPFLLYWLIGPTYRLSLRLERELIGALRPHWKELVLAYKGRHIMLRGGILFEIKSGDRPDTLVADYVDGIGITEAARLNPKAWNEALHTRLRGRAPKSGDNGRAPGWARFDSTPKGRNWWWRDVLRHGDKDDPKYDGRHLDPTSERYGLPPQYENHRWRTVDNDRSPATVAFAADAKRTMPARYYRRDFEAALDTFEGQIYDEFSEAVHVIDDADLPAMVETIGGQDWGWSHPGCLVVVGRDGDGSWYVLDEVYETGLLVEPQAGGDSWVNRAQEMVERWKCSSIECGPDRPENIVTYQRHGLPAQGADDAVYDGIQRLATRMHYAAADGVLAEIKPTWFVHRRCANVIRQIGGYKWREFNADRPHKEEPLKVEDDAADAVRYACNRWRDGGEAVDSYTPRVERALHAPPAEERIAPEPMVERRPSLGRMMRGGSR